MRNPYISLFSIVWTFADSEQRVRIVIAYTLLFMANATLATIPFLFGWFINSVQQASVDILSYVWFYAGAYFGLIVLQWSFLRPARIMERRLAFQVSENFLNETFNQLMSLPIEWHKDHHSGAMTNRLRKAKTSLRQFFENGFMFFQTITQVSISAAAILYFSPIFGVIAIVIGFFTIWINYKFDRPVIKFMNEFNEAEHKVSATLSDILSNILTVITLRIEKLTQNELQDKMRKMFSPYIRLASISEWKWFTLNMFVILIYLVVLIGYIYTNYRPGEIFYLGGMVTLMGFVNQFTTTFYAVGSQYTNLVQFHTDIQAVEGIKEAWKKTNRNAFVPEIDKWQTLEVKHLNFTYAKSESRIADPGYSQNDISLRIVDLNLKKGQRIAIIGKSGAGKSTLLALLRGLYLPASAEVVTDGVSQCEFAAISGTTTLFPQDPEIFENTIRYNITLGLPFDEREIRAACEIACFTEVINQIPSGLDAAIHEKGINLSGGQKQRLGLVRGLLVSVDSDIVLLDEPTNRVDSKTETEIYSRLFEVFKYKTIICSVHNFNLLKIFDHVYHLHDGQIIDQGIPGKFV